MTNPFGNYPWKHLGREEERANALPDGTSKEVLDWVGDDTDRASAALEREQADPQPRKTLVAALKKLV